MKIKFFIIAFMSLSLSNSINATSNKELPKNNNQEARSLSGQERITICFLGMSILWLVVYNRDLIDHYSDQSNKFLEFRENNLMQDIVSIKNGVSLNHVTLPLKIIKLLGQELFIRGLNTLIAFGLFMTLPVTFAAIFEDIKFPSPQELLFKIPIIPGITI